MTKWLKKETNHSLVVTGRVWVVKVTVWVDSAEEAQAQPTEVLFTRGTGHLVTAIHFLEGHRDKASEGEDSANMSSN